MAKQHIKPTQEELQENIKKVQEELENDAPEPEVIPEVEKPEEETPEPEPETPEVEEEAEESEPEPAPEPDYKKKFSESSKEAQKIVAKNRKLNQAIDKAAELAEPTEEELQAEYSDWDALDDTTKKIAKDALTASRRFATIEQGREESKKIEKWDEDVNKFTEDPQSLIDHPELEGKVEEFKLFANEESNTNVPFKVLVTSFLYQQSQKAKPKNKGRMFESGSGGPNERDTNKNAGKITLEEASKLMETNYNKYKEYLLAGKILNE